MSSKFTKEGTKTEQNTGSFNFDLERTIKAANAPSKIMPKGLTSAERLAWMREFSEQKST
ncbi:hypothetical protein [Spartinivicinus poritis]|uniref:Uncharacterized protein n=1 Tax=Spartinivicinus poritis TaxID=2994640 RepID=A0ABT5UHT5_9GAMM|nr:hypothetical protein [Spartinivicinus sp. A2-2]MDE1465887.1 hypothetical protein [Spartinivicinus sp. A2-2]